MKRRLQVGCTLAAICLLLGAAGCAPEERPEDAGAPEAAPALVVVNSAAELAAFFEAGGAAAELAADINMGEDMLKLEPGRGAIAIHGKGHTISGSAPSIIRVAQGGGIRLEDVTLQAEKIGIGFLGAGELDAVGCAIEAGSNAVQAAGLLRLAKDASLAVTSRAGAGIVCVGLELGASARLQAQGDLFAISAGRGDILLEEGAVASCEAAGDNAVKTDGVLELHPGSTFASRNTGDHNAAKIGALEAAVNARLELTGGENGVGLFIVEQYEDVVVQGFCKPEQKIETGKGVVEFTEQ